jgi:hypothetical protein
VRYQDKVMRIDFLADAAFAMPGVYEYLEAGGALGVGFTVRDGDYLSARCGRRTSLCRRTRRDDRLMAVLVAHRASLRHRDVTTVLRNRRGRGTAPFRNLKRHGGDRGRPHDLNGRLRLSGCACIAPGAAATTVDD